jgi:SNF2 family DNA or RNA helicase
MSSQRLSVDRPPLFTARNRSAWTTGGEALKRLGVTRALGYASSSLIITMNKADELQELTADQEAQLSEAIGRLSDLWARWTEQEREEFYFTFLDTARQPHFARPYSEPQIYIPQHPRGMEEMRRRGWTPHPYQARAVQFAIERPRSVLALEMGLGKTLIALMTYHLLRQRGDLKRVIIAAPKSAHASWREHLELSDAQIYVLTSQTPEKREAIYTALYHGQLEGVLITPQTLAIDRSYFKRLMSREPYLLVADEVHKFKAPRGINGLCFQELSKSAARVIGLTGTPKPNAVEDFYHVVDRVAPGTLGDIQEFTSRYTYRKLAQYDSIRGPQYEMGALRGDMLGELYERLKDTLFTRNTSDPDARLDLPPREDLAPYIPPDENQKRLMKALIEMQAARELNASSYREALEGERGFESLIAAEGAPQTAQALGIRLEQLTISPAIFSESFSAHAPDYESPKMRWIIDMIMRYLSEDPTHAAVIFCEYIVGLTEARKALIRRGLKSSEIDIYTGESSESQRAEMTARLNEGGSKVLLGQTRALETGANLQKRAAMVAHLSTPWAPDTLTQSTARVYRQGQRRPVIVLRPSGSRLEEAKNKALTRKIMQSASLTGALTDADRAVIETSADERIRRAHARLLERGAYDLAIIQTLISLER